MWGKPQSSSKYARAHARANTRFGPARSGDSGLRTHRPAEERARPLAIAGARRPAPHRRKEILRGGARGTWRFYTFWGLRLPRPPLPLRGLFFSSSLASSAFPGKVDRAAGEGGRAPPQLRLPPARDRSGGPTPRRPGPGSPPRGRPGTAQRFARRYRGSGAPGAGNADSAAPPAVWKSRRLSLTRKRMTVDRKWRRKEPRGAGRGGAARGGLLRCGTRRSPPGLQDSPQVEPGCPEFLGRLPSGKSSMKSWTLRSGRAKESSEKVRASEPLGVHGGPDISFPRPVLTFFVLQRRSNASMFYFWEFASWTRVLENWLTKTVSGNGFNGLPPRYCNHVTSKWKYCL